MDFSPALQQAIEEVAALQGISPEQFIVQTLIEKINTLQPQFLREFRKAGSSVI